MLADFLSKPLQGSLFRKFRDVLLGLAHFSTLRLPAGLPGEERVAGCADEPSTDTRESRTGVVNNNTDASVPIRADLDFRPAVISLIRALLLLYKRGPSG